MKVLIVSNLDSSRPFGQFLRPFHLGRALADAGVEVANVGVDCSSVDFGPEWSVGEKSLRAVARGVRSALSELSPDVIYGHELRGGLAGLLAAPRLPLAGDFHSLPSVEWYGYTRTARGASRARYAVHGTRARLAERLIARRADLVVAAGDGVARELSSRYRPRAAPLVIPNGVTEPLLDAPLRASASPYESSGRKHVVAVVPGDQSDANLRALEFLVGAARELEGEDGAPTVHVVGSDAGPEAPNVSYEGFQPDLLPWLEHADACLLPYPPEAALCGGARNKLLEALARGRRVVTTEEGLRGVEEAAGWSGVHVAGDAPRAFAATLLRSVRPDAPSLDEVRPTLRERLRWDARVGELRDALAALAAR